MFVEQTTFLLGCLLMLSAEVILTCF